MKYDSAKHHRRSLRLDDFDYSSPGAYFVTIVVRDRKCLLGDVTPDGVMSLSELGHVTQADWQALPTRFPHASLDEYVVMPNHLHGILVLQESRHGSEVPPALPAHGTQPGSLAAIVQNFKALSSRRLNGVRGTPGATFWHRNYWEHVVRGTTDLEQIRDYIQSNPARWALDQLHPATAGRQKGGG